MWDAAKHPHGFHGHWASKGGGQIARRTADSEHILSQRPSTRRSPSAFQPPKSAAARRTEKRHLQQRMEVARGARSPRNQAERGVVEWASPKKQAEQIALTGNVRIPRKEAIGRERSRNRSGLPPTVGTKATFSGKKRRVRDVTPPPGTRMTSRGRFNAARSN